MNKNQKASELSNVMLWAAAIIASALLGNSSFLTIIILPVLALMSISKSVYLNKKDVNKDPKMNDQ